MLGVTKKIYLQTSTGIFAPMVRIYLFVSHTFLTDTEEKHVKVQRNSGSIISSGPRFQTSVCPKSDLELDPYSFLCTLLIDSHTAQC